MHNFQDTAFFVKQPFGVEDLRRPHRLKQRQPFTIEKTIDLEWIDYENLVTDLSTAGSLKNTSGSAVSTTTAFGIAFWSGSAAKRMGC